ncbi:hypothetical protein E5Q_04907 [Mixia osmundae IAM 14324]|uniref:Glycine cleavage system H protein n=1 Tax=Mixia osmundae (strain CBS 9802 / IAM 14324 / JCM 22182 / KY 12970) TaxID=764103 RepID=G7E5W4_MIXOS|nr:hypothetical protein E5Q_04907 [Mixia osmundae IAM 14324]
MLRQFSTFARSKRSSPVARASFVRPVAASFAARRWASSTRYTIEHEWITYDDETYIGTIGITDYAAKSLGDVVFVELPNPSDEIATGDTIGSVESVKAASDIYAPVSGTVEEVNTALADQSSLLNKSPEQDGWLCKIKLTRPTEFDGLLTAEAYKAHCEGSED